MKRILNLGCGNKIVLAGKDEEVVNHDLVAHRAEVTAIADLDDLPWPWADNSFDHIVARAVLEHLRINLFESVGECWRILRPGGILSLKLPYWNHDHAYLDPSHYWRFDIRTCDMFDPETEWGRDYRFYGQTAGRKWKIIKPARLNRSRSSIFVTLQVRKDANLGAQAAQKPSIAPLPDAPMPETEGEET